NTATSNGGEGRRWYDKGKELEREGDTAGALEAYKNSLRADSKKAAPWVKIAQLLEHNQQNAEALECYKRAVAVDPFHPVVHVKYANALSAAGNVTQAISEYERALQIDKQHRQAYQGLGMAYEHKGEPAKAADYYRKALAIDPDAAEVLGNLIALGRHVDVDDAIESAREKIAAAQTQMEANEEALALDGKRDDGDEDGGDQDDVGPLSVGDLEAEAETAHRPPAQKNEDGRLTPSARIATIAYGLGKELERRGDDYEDAFAAYASANNARKRAAGAFNRDAFDSRIDKLCEIFSPEFYADRAGWGDPSEVPVFVVGLPRSGTTLTEQILSSHPLCHGAGEIDALADMATGTPDRLGTNETRWPDCADRLSREHINALAKDYLARLTKGAPREAVRVTDKQPLNFFHIGLIALAFPNARILHCQRDLRDNGFSIYSENFNYSQRWSTDLADIAHYWRGYRRLMAHFRENLPINMLDVRYEETVADQEAASRRLLDFMGLDWDASVLSFHKNDRAVQTPSRWQVRQPIYKQSAGRWRRFEAHLGQLIEAQLEADAAQSKK
ncbi:MAG: sulfotransferase, partial [Pseudomonadota bacterium]